MVKVSDGLFPRRAGSLVVFQCVVTHFLHCMSLAVRGTLSGLAFLAFNQWISQFWKPPAAPSQFTTTDSSSSELRLPRTSVSVMSSISMTTSPSTAQLCCVTGHNHSTAPSLHFLLDFIMRDLLLMKTHNINAVRISRCPNDPRP
ncbi:hypothetical protein V1527DRAFT_281706 [Lipomyces starkeyi]